MSAQMVSKFSLEQRLAILREYDAGGISLIELGAKYAVNESTLSGWRCRGRIEASLDERTGSQWNNTETASENVSCCRPNRTLVVLT